MNYYQRNFMQYLRSGNWVSIAALPDSPSTKSKVVELGWVEQRGRGSEACYRITESGLEALRAPMPLRKSTVPINKEIYSYRLHNGVNRVYSDKVRRLPGQAVFLHGGVICLNHLIRRNRWSNAARPRCGG